VGGARQHFKLVAPGQDLELDRRARIRHRFGGSGTTRAAPRS